MPSFPWRGDCVIVCSLDWWRKWVSILCHRPQTHLTTKSSLRKAVNMTGGQYWGQIGVGGIKLAVFTASLGERWYRQVIEAMSKHSFCPNAPSPNPSTAPQFTQPLWKAKMLRLSEPQRSPREVFRPLIGYFSHPCLCSSSQKKLTHGHSLSSFLTVMPSVACGTVRSSPPTLIHNSSYYPLTRLLWRLYESASFIIHCEVPYQHWSLVLFYYH